MKPTSILLAAAILCSAAWADKPQPKRSLAEKLGHPATAKLLIIHGNDLGMTPAINAATLTALEKGWITSAGVIPVAPHVAQVAAWAKSHPGYDLGARISYSSGWAGARWAPASPLTRQTEMVTPEGFFRETPVNGTPEEMRVEAQAQIDRLKAEGIQATHLDTQMLVLDSRENENLYAELGEANHLPIISGHYYNILFSLPEMRRMMPKQFMAAHYDVYPQHVVNLRLELDTDMPDSRWLEAYEATLRELPKGGVYLLYVCLGMNNDQELQRISGGVREWGAQWRQNDLNLVANPEFQQFLKRNDFVLVSWLDIARAEAMPD